MESVCTSGPQPFLSRGPLDCERPRPLQCGLKSLAPEIKMYFTTTMVQLVWSDVHCDVASGAQLENSTLLAFESHGKTKGHSPPCNTI